MFDDDFTYNFLTYTTPGCLCDGHIAMINAITGEEKKREELASLLQAILSCLRDLLLCKQTDGAPLCFFADREEAFALSYRFTTPELLSLCECVSAAQDQLLANANIRLLLISLATRCGLL